MVECLNVSAYTKPSLGMEANEMTVTYIEISVHKDSYIYFRNLYME